MSCCCGYNGGKGQSGMGFFSIKFVAQCPFSTALSISPSPSSGSQGMLFKMVILCSSYCPQLQKLHSLYNRVAIDSISNGWEQRVTKVMSYTRTEWNDGKMQRRGWKTNNNMTKFRMAMIHDIRKGIIRKVHDQIKLIGPEAMGDMISEAILLLSHNLMIGVGKLYDPCAIPIYAIIV